MKLKFLTTFLRFNPVARSVHLLGERNGREVHVFITRTALAWLCEDEELTSDVAITAVVRHKRLLLAAASIALQRTGGEIGGVAVTLPDVRLAELGEPDAAARIHAGRAHGTKHETR